MKELHPKTESLRPRSSSPSLKELLCMAQAGSREAYLVLRERYRPLFEASLARFGSSEMTLQEREDMREEAERVFIAAISSYDTEQEGVDFGLYAKICLQNGLISEWRRLGSRRRTAPIPLEEDMGVEEEDPAARLEEEERFHQLCLTVRGYLSEFENRVWWQYVTGVSVADIARELGCEEKSVHNAIYRIRRKLRARLQPPED